MAYRACRGGKGPGAWLGQAVRTMPVLRETPMPGQSVMPDALVSSAAACARPARPGDGMLAPGLQVFLAGVPDHRRAQGRRHGLGARSEGAEQGRERQCHLGVVRLGGQPG